MKKKKAGLPLWAWGVIGVAAIYFWYRYQQSGSSSTTAANTPTGSVLDPNAVDPNTGLTYGQEESAALGAGAAANAPGAGGSSNGTDTTNPPDTFDQQLGNLLSLVSAFNLVPAGSQAAAPAPVQAASPPTVAPQVNTPQTSYTSGLANQNAGVVGQINSLLSSGYHKIAGTTQQGGLAQTGTYVKGSTKYFVWGTPTTGLSIRKAAPAPTKVKGP
jgi:hypothetical protein